MRNLALFPKLALQSIRNNRQFYLPYVLALLGDVAAIYIMSALSHDPGVVNMTPGRGNAYMYVQTFMAIGKAKASLFIACLRKVILLIPLIFLLPQFFTNKVFAVFLAEPVSDLISVVVSAVTFYRVFRPEMAALERRQAEGGA